MKKIVQSIAFAAVSLVGVQSIQAAEQCAAPQFMASEEQRTETLHNYSRVDLEEALPGTWTSHIENEETGIEMSWTLVYQDNGTYESKYTISQPGEMDQEILETGTWTAIQNNKVALTASIIYGGNVYMNEAEVFIHDIDSMKMTQVVQDFFAFEYTKQTPNP